MAATTYIIMSWLWNAAVWGTAAYLVFWKEPLGWFSLFVIVLAFLLSCTGIEKDAAKIAGTWTKDMED